MAAPGWIERYWEDGFAIVRGVFAPARMAELGRYFDEIPADAARRDAGDRERGADGVPAPYSSTACRL